MSKLTAQKDISFSEKLPWQEDLWNRFFRFIFPPTQRAMPHAFYFSGRSGIGKRHFIKQFIQLFFCLNRTVNALACGRCRSCLWMSEGVHSGLRWIAPESEQELIKVEQIRDMESFVNETGLHDVSRFVVIEPVQKMNAASANALLKLLEEPPSDVYFILIDDERGSLLPSTVISRCHRVRCAPVSLEACSAWLAAHGLPSLESQRMALSLMEGSPFHVIQKPEWYVTRSTILNGLQAVTHQHRHPVLVSQDWMNQKIPLNIALECIMSLSVDVVRYQNRIFSASNNDYMACIEWCATHTEPYYVACYLDGLTMMKRVLTQGVHLNVQLALDVLLMRWQRLLSKQEWKVHDELS